MARSAAVLVQHRPDALPTFDAEAAQKAVELTPGALQAWASERAVELSQQDYDVIYEQGYAERHATTTARDDGMAWLKALIPAMDAELIAKKIYATASPSAATGHQRRTAKRPARSDRRRPSPSARPRTAPISYPLPDPGAGRRPLIREGLVGR